MSLFNKNKKNAGTGDAATAEPMQWLTRSAAAQMLGVTEADIVNLASHDVLCALPCADGELYPAFEVKALAGSDGAKEFSESLEQFARLQEDVKSAVRKKEDALARLKAEEEAAGALATQKAEKNAETEAFIQTCGGKEVLSNMAKFAASMLGAIRASGLSDEIRIGKEAEFVEKSLMALSVEDICQKMGMTYDQFRARNALLMSTMQYKCVMDEARSIIAMRKERDHYKEESERLKKMLLDLGVDVEAPQEA